MYSDNIFFRIRQQKIRTKRRTKEEVFRVFVYISCTHTLRPPNVNTCCYHICLYELRSWHVLTGAKNFFLKSPGMNDDDATTTTATTTTVFTSYVCALHVITFYTLATPFICAICIFQKHTTLDLLSIALIVRCLKRARAYSYTHCIFLRILRRRVRDMARWTTLSRQTWSAYEQNATG